MSQPPSQFSLFRSRRFAPFFCTQFLGAFNDNVFKNALLGMVTYGLLQSQLDLSALNNLGALLFILPFFLFSALAGQLADKYDKALLIRRIKLAEVVIMAFGATCFLIGSTAGLLVMLFLMGSQSAFFGPAKYGIIPQHLSDNELVGGNALVEMGTFLAILTGTITAGLISTHDNSIVLASVSVVALALAGYLTSRQIPPAPPKAPELTLNFNIVTATLHTLRFSRRNPSVFIATLGISWFWFLGAAYLTQFFVFSKDYLHGDQGVVTILLATFSIGIALGSLLCNRLSRGQLEPGLIPLGAVGCIIAGLGLVFYPAVEAPDTLFTASEFIVLPQAWWIIGVLLTLGGFAGIYVVPLYTLVQKRAEAAHLSRIIAAISIANALFMVLSAVAGIVVMGILGISVPGFFLILSIGSALAAVWMFRAMPELPRSFLIWSGIRTPE